MNEASIRRQIEELLKTVAIPCSPGKASDDSVYVSVETDSADPVAECLDRLWLQVKYLIFDLEATRRENRCFRIILGSRNRSAQKDAEEDDLD